LRTSLPDLAFQIRIVLSYEPDMIRLPSGENATDSTQPLWPSSLRTSLPDLASQIWTVLSPEPDTIWLLSGENATDLTEPVWPSSLRTSLPELVSQIRTVLSCEPDAMRLPSGENATDLTEWLWPSNVWRHGLQCFSTTGFVKTQVGSSTLKKMRIMLSRGVNSSADTYVCSGACSIIHRLCKMNRYASSIRLMNVLSLVV